MSSSTLERNCSSSSTYLLAHYTCYPPAIEPFISAVNHQQRDRMFWAKSRPITCENGPSALVWANPVILLRRRILPKVQWQRTKKLLYFGQIMTLKCGPSAWRTLAKQEMNHHFGPPVEQVKMLPCTHFLRVLYCEIATAYCVGQS